MHGDRVGTIAWNGYRHLELYYAVSGSGAVLHTLNPRLHADQVVWIGDHAEDKVLCFDKTFLPLVEAVASRLATVKHFVLMADRSHMPASTAIPNLLCYEDLVEAQPDDFEWPRVRRGNGIEPVLHQRHHRQPQGRAVQPPLHGPAHLRRRRCPTR